MTATAFRLSRISAEGWNKALELSADESVDMGRGAALNPYAAEPEKSRWLEGFAKAIGAQVTP